MAPEIVQNSELEILAEEDTVGVTEAERHEDRYDTTQALNEGKVAHGSIIAEIWDPSASKVSERAAEIITRLHAKQAALAGDGQAAHSTGSAVKGGGGAHRGNDDRSDGSAFRVEVEGEEGSRGDSSSGTDPAVTQGKQLKQVKKGGHGSDAIRQTQM